MNLLNKTTMIQENDVRRNNWVLFDDKYFKIDTISEEFPTLDTTEFGIGVVNWNNIHPIPLTEEVLLKCGFEKKKWDNPHLIIQDTYYQLGNIAIYLLRDSFEVELIVGKNVKQFNLFINFKKQLHILQNLYWCLCGKELSVNV